jgi:hypothetical protein
MHKPQILGALVRERFLAIPERADEQMHERKREMLLVRLETNKFGDGRKRSDFTSHCNNHDSRMLVAVRVRAALAIESRDVTVQACVETLGARRDRKDGHALMSQE